MTGLIKDFISSIAMLPHVNQPSNHECKWWWKDTRSVKISFAFQSYHFCQLLEIKDNPW